MLSLATALETLASDSGVSNEREELEAIKQRLEALVDKPDKQSMGQELTQVSEKISQILIKSEEADLQAMGQIAKSEDGLASTDESTRIQIMTNIAEIKTRTTRQKEELDRMSKQTIEGVLADGHIPKPTALFDDSSRKRSRRKKSSKDAKKEEKKAEIKPTTTKVATPAVPAPAKPAAEAVKLEKPLEKVLKTETEAAREGSVVKDEFQKELEEAGEPSMGVEELREEFFKGSEEKEEEAKAEAEAAVETTEAGAKEAESEAEAQDFTKEIDTQARLQNRISAMLKKIEERIDLSDESIADTMKRIDEDEAVKYCIFCLCLVLFLFVCLLFLSEFEMFFVCFGFDCVEYQSLRHKYK